MGFDNGKWTSAINVHCSVCHPKLRDWLMMGFGHYSVSLFSLLSSMQCGEGDLRIAEVIFCWVSKHCLIVRRLAMISILLIHLVAHGCR